MTKLIKNQKNVFLGKLIFGLMYFFLLSTNLYSIEPLIIKEDIGEYPLGMHLELLEDKEGILSINDLKNQDGKQNWIKSKSNIPNLAYTKSVYWIHFNIENQMEDKEFILEISYPLLDKLELYYSENNSSEFLVKKGGDFSPFNTRDIRYHNFLFRLPIKLNETKRIFLRVETASSMQIPLKLYTPVSLIQKVNLEMVALGIYYGIMMAMILYNSFLFISVRDKSYLYYVLYITSFAILQATINGVIFEYFGNFFPFINETAAYQMIICCIFIVLFVRSFLQTKENAPKLNRVLKGLFIYLCIVPFFFLKLNYSQGAKIASITVILCLLLVIIIGFIVLRRGFKPARYFLLAWMFFLVGSILLALRQVGILPSFFLTENGAQIGSTIEVMLLSLGLGDRINVMR